MWTHSGLTSHWIINETYNLHHSSYTKQFCANIFIFFNNNDKNNPKRIKMFVLLQVNRIEHLLTHAIVELPGLVGEFPGAMTEA